MKYLYDLYEGERKIQSSMTAKELRTYANLSDSTRINDYTANRCLLCGKYRVVKSGEKKKSQSKLDTAKAIHEIGLETYNELKVLHERYGRKKDGRHN